MTAITKISEDRDLTEDEASFIRWCLHHGTADAAEYLLQLDRARVASRCSCGCASIDFAIDGLVPYEGTAMNILSDFEWTDTAGRVFGAFVFAKCGLLAGLEVWSQDGLSTPNILPTIDQLRSIGTGILGEQSHAPQPAAGPDSNGKSSPPAP